MIAVLPLLLVLSQAGSAGIYDYNGNTLQDHPGTSAPGDVLNSYSAGNNPNSGAARNGSTLLLISAYDGLAQIYFVNEATGASTGSVPVLDSADFGLGYDTSRSLYITCNASSDIVNTFNSSGSLVNSWSAPAFGPVGVAYDAGRDVYWICDWQTSTVTSMNATTGASITTWSTATVGCTRPAGVAFDNANDQVIVGGRDQSTIFVMDAATGTLVRSFAAQDGSNNSQGLAGSSSGDVWQTSWNSSNVYELDLGNVGLSLTITGSCPGNMSVSISGATAFGSVAIAYGNPGSFTIPNGSCSGLTIDVGSPTLAGFFNADALGSINLNPNVPAGLCGRTVQAVDMTSCTKSNTATL